MIKDFPLITEVVKGGLLVRCVSYLPAQGIRSILLGKRIINLEGRVTSFPDPKEQPVIVIRMTNWYLMVPRNLLQFAKWCCSDGLGGSLEIEVIPSLAQQENRSQPHGGGMYLSVDRQGELQFLN